MPARRFFQIHLSTAVVLMLVAVLLLFANVRRQTRTVFPVKPVSSILGTDSYTAYGWPFECKTEAEIEFPSLNSSSKVVTIISWQKPMIVYNALIALAILIMLAVLCECNIYLRAEREANE